jgi:hypothetical protein
MCTVFADVREDLVAAAVPASPRPELAVAWVGDLASRGALRRFVGCRTHFVHSAAAQRHEADHALAVTTETWERMRAVNVDAGFHLARELARQLIAARQPGSFLMLTSLHAGTPRNLLQHSQSGPHYDGEGAGQDLRALWNPGQRFGAGRDCRGRFRCRPVAGALHPARPTWSQRRSCSNGTSGAPPPSKRERTVDGATSPSLATLYVLATASEVYESFGGCVRYQ